MMEKFTLNDLRAAVEFSSVSFGVFEKSLRRITAPNEALRRRVGRTVFSINIVAEAEGRIYGALVEDKIPLSLRILSGEEDRYLVEVYLAHAKAKNPSYPSSDLIQLVDMTSDGVWEWFPSLQYEFMSERFWSILGYDHRLMPSSPDAWMNIIDPDGLKTATQMYNAHVATRGVSEYNLNVTYTHKDGHDVQIKCRGAVVEWLPDGSPWRLLGTHTDITEITEAVDAKAHFVSRMSHEIRTPICAILHECEDLYNLPGMSVISDSCDQLLELCNDILTLDKFRRPISFSATRRSADVQDFFQKALRRHMGEAQKKGIHLDNKLHSLPPGQVMMDVSKCNQVVDNLVSNAIKYTESGGGVCVEMQCEPHMVAANGAIDLDVEKLPKSDDEIWQIIIAVKDNGQGIHPEDREYIFNKFSQADSSMEGAGLGLSISKELATVMSGDVLLTSTDLGKGSTFEFRFPASCTTSPYLLCPEDMVGEGAEKPVVRVLSADDMLTNRKIMRRRLRAIEDQLVVVTIDVVDAVDGRDAVEKFQSPGNFDLIFMDCLMPEMNGFEASMAIHELCDSRGIPRVPVVAVTASISTSLHEECREAGMSQVVTKPFDVMDLMPMFLAVVDARRAQETTATSPKSQLTSTTSCSPSTTPSIGDIARDRATRSPSPSPPPPPVPLSAGIYFRHGVRFSTGG